MIRAIAICSIGQFERWSVTIKSHLAYMGIMYKLRPKPNVYRSRQAFIS